MSGGFEEARRCGRLVLLEIGRIGKGMGERAMGRHLREVAPQRLLHITLNDPDIAAEIVALGILLSEKRIARRNLDAGDMHRGNPHRHTEGRNAGADARLEQGFARPAGNSGGEVNRVYSCAVTLFGLVYLEPTAEESIFSLRGRDRATGRLRLRARIVSVCAQPGRM